MQVRWSERWSTEQKSHHLSRRLQDARLQLADLKRQLQHKDDQLEVRIHIRCVTCATYTCDGGQQVLQKAKRDLTAWKASHEATTSQLEQQLSKRTTYTVADIRRLRRTLRDSQDVCLCTVLCLRWHPSLTHAHKQSATELASASKLVTKHAVSVEKSMASKHAAFQQRLKHERASLTVGRALHSPMSSVSPWYVFCGTAFATACAETHARNGAAYKSV